MQKGHIYRKGSLWMLQYWKPVIEDGKLVKRRVAEKLATWSRDEYRTEESVKPLAIKILNPINARTARPESNELVSRFLEYVYLPACDVELRPSTCHGYRDCFKLLKPYLGDLQISETRTSNIDRLLRAVADSKPRAKTVLTNVRNFLSGAFRFAIRTDRLDGQNPVRECKVPKGRKLQTYAYSLAEITAMLEVLSEPARTVILVAALTGLRHSEIRGLRWDDFTGDEILVRRSAWRTWVSDDGETKTEGSTAAVPVVPIVKRALMAHRKREAGDGFIFSGITGRPLTLANLVRRDIKPAFDKAKIVWHGWHAFRRGVGSNLYALGVPDKTIQEILRHANVTTTQTFYIKTASEASKAAMKKLEKAFSKSGKKRHK